MTALFQKLTTSCIKASSLLNMDCLQLHKCFQQVKEYGEKLKTSEQDLQVSFSISLNVIALPHHHSFVTLGLLACFFCFLFLFLRSILEFECQNMMDYHIRVSVNMLMLKIFIN